ncbi:hypothetical protein PFISCL1PPCAC_27559, partial [Pristionchus fissidentatus]
RQRQEEQERARAEEERADSEEEEEEEEELEEERRREKEEAEKNVSQSQFFRFRRLLKRMLLSLNLIDIFQARKIAEREKKKAEVRKRLEEAGRAKKAKKGFLTPDRKKKLRKLLMMKAAEDLKEKQRQLELERQRILQERILPLPDLDSHDLAECFEEMKRHVLKLEADTYDINYAVRQKDFEINELTIAVNDLRGKFVKPTLKKVSKTENRFDKLKKKESTKVN